MLVERPKNPMQIEKEREEEAQDKYKGPRSVSSIGGQGGCLVSFSQGASYASGGR